MAYRDSSASSDDATQAAVAELGRRLATLRQVVVLPGGLLALAAGIAGALAHVSGYWSVFSALPDGTYFVAAPTIVIAVLAPGSLVFGPVWLAYLGLRARARRAWLAEAPTRFGVAREELEALAGLFD